MEEQVSCRIFLLFICTVSLLLAVGGLTAASTEGFIVFGAIFAYAFIMLFWNETRE
jgi:hypothetical protein